MSFSEQDEIREGFLLPVLICKKQAFQKKNKQKVCNSSYLSAHLGMYHTSPTLFTILLMALEKLNGISRRYRRRIVESNKI